MTSIDTESAPAERSAAWVPSKPSARVVAFAVASVAAAVAFRSLFDLETPRGPGLRGAEAFMFSPSGGSPTIIFGATIWLFVRRWHRFVAAIGQPPQRIAGAALVAIGSTLCAWSYYTSEIPLLLPALSAVMLGSALWLGGFRAARAILLPAIFLLLATPAPPVLLNPILYPVQLATVQSTTWILNHVGLGPALSSGDRILHGRAVFQVIEACSGVRTVQTILMASFLYHDLFFRTRLQSALIIAFSPLIGLVANQIRVLAIVLNPYSKFAAVHTAQGLVMIVVAVFMLAGLDLLLNRLLPASERQRRRRIPSEPVPIPRAAALAVALAALAALTFAIRPWSPPPTTLRSLSTLPPQLDGWQASGLNLDKEFLGTATFSEWVHRRYEKDGHSVDVLIGSDDRIDPRTDFDSPKTVVLESGFTFAADGSVELAGGRKAARYETELRDDRELVYVWSEGTASRGEEIVRALFALDRTPLRREGRSLLIRLNTPIGSDGREAAEARLAAFAAVLDPVIPRDGTPAKVSPQ